MSKDQRQKCSGEHVRQAVVFFFAAGDLAWLWGWKSHGGERERERVNRTNLFGFRNKYRMY